MHWQRCRSNSLEVTDVPIGSIASVAGLHAFASMTVSTDVAGIDANLGSGSPLALYASSIVGMTIGDGPVVLDDATAKAADMGALGTLPAGSLQVTGVAVTDIAQIAAIGALDSMTVSDDAHNLAADLRLDPSMSELALHAAKIESVTVNDSGAVAAADAAELANIVTALTGPAFSVSDTAAAVDAALGGLASLGAHLSTVTVADSAADVSVHAADLAALGGKLILALSDGATFTVHADVAAGLVPLVSYLTGSEINVSDTGGNVAAHANALTGLGALLGTVTLSDGSSTDAATAAGLAPIADNLGIGVVIDVADNAAAIAGAAGGLGTLQTAGHISSVTAAGQTAADIVTYGATLSGLGATATISDTAAQVSQNLDALEAYSHAGGLVRGITLSDSGDVAVSIGQFTSDSDVLGWIGGAFQYAIANSSTGIAGDLGAGINSHILGLGAAVDTITVNGGVLSLDAGTLRAAGVDAALAKLAGGTLIDATNVSIDDFAAIDLLAIQPDHYAVADSGGNIATDLELGAGSSALLAHRGSIAGIDPTGTVSIDYATATAQHVDDGAGSVFSMMPGAALDVTGVAIGHVPAMFALPVAAATVAVSDSAGDIEGDLTGGSSTLLQYLGQIDTIAVNSGSTITLSAGQALTTGVDDTSGSVFGKMSGGTLAVTGATVGQLDSLHGLYRMPASVAVNDEASAIATDLRLGAGSRLETYAASTLVTGITVLDGPVLLGDAYVAGGLVADALAALPLEQPGSDRCADRQHRLGRGAARFRLDDGVDGRGGDRRQPGFRLAAGAVCEFDRRHDDRRRSGGAGRRDGEGGGHGCPWHAAGGQFAGDRRRGDRHRADRRDRRARQHGRQRRRRHDPHGPAAGRLALRARAERGEDLRRDRHRRHGVAERRRGRAGCRRAGHVARRQPDHHRCAGAERRDVWRAAGTVVDDGDGHRRRCAA